MNVVTLRELRQGTSTEVKERQRRQEKEGDRWRDLIFVSSLTRRITGRAMAAQFPGREEFIIYACVTRLWLISHLFSPRTTNDTLADYYLSYPSKPRLLPKISAFNFPARDILSDKPGRCCDLLLDQRDVICSNSGWTYRKAICFKRLRVWVF